MSLSDHLIRIQNPDLRILTIDIERLAGLARAWEPKTRFIAAANFVREPRTICYAFRWYGERKVQFDAEWLDGGHEGMTRRVHALYDQADIVYTYNGIRFDNKHLQGDWLKIGLVKPKPWKDVDLYPVTSQFGYLSRSLDYTTRALGRPGKQLHYNHELAEAAVAGDEASRKELAKYNKGDVELTEWLADRLRPWIKGHPFPRSLGDEHQCPYCGSADLASKGRTRAVVLEYALYQCKRCNGWVRGGWEARAANTRAAS